jgi:hypothetical protein
MIVFWYHTAEGTAAEVVKDPAGKHATSAASSSLLDQPSSVPTFSFAFNQQSTKKQDKIVPFSSLKPQENQKRKCGCSCNIL